MIIHHTAHSLIQRYIGTFFLGLSLIIMLGIASDAYAESVVWKKTETINLCVVKGSKCPDNKMQIRAPHMQIHYNVRVIDMATGAVIPNDTTVSQGTKVRFEFIPHTYQDISWSGTGYVQDTPYGDWRTQAGIPVPVVNGDAYMCLAKNYLETLYKKYTMSLYGSLTVEPPKKSIPGLPGSCTPVGGYDQECVLDTLGVFNPIFTFAPTFGHFYAGISFGTDSQPRDDALETTGQCVVAQTNNWDPYFIQDSTGKSIISPEPMRTTNTRTVYTLDVPQQSVPFKITVIASTGGSPSIPSLSSGGSCFVGLPHAISMTANDPDGDNIRYGIDWNNDGTVDQFVPPTSYVASGTTQSASRTYTTAGSRTVRVFAQDESGLVSGWSTHSFTCTENIEQLCETISCDDMSEEIIRNEGYGTPNNNENWGNDIDLSLRVIPSLVRPDETTQVYWSADGTENCTVTAPNGDSWVGTESPIGGETSSPITGETIYTLQCGEADPVTARVNIIPLWREF